MMPVMLAAMQHRYREKEREREREYNRIGHHIWSYVVLTYNSNLERQQDRGFSTKAGASQVLRAGGYKRILTKRVSSSITSSIPSSLRS